MRDFSISSVPLCPSFPLLHIAGVSIKKKITSMSSDMQGRTTFRKSPNDKRNRSKQYEPFFSMKYGGGTREESYTSARCISGGFYG